MKQNWISHVVSSFGNDILYKIRISSRFGIENYAGKVGIIQKIFVNIVIFVCLWFSVPNCPDTSRQNCQYPLSKKCRFLLLAISIMAVWRHFGTEHYAWGLGVVQDLWEYCGFFLSDFLGLKYPDTHNSYIMTLYK